MNSLFPGSLQLALAHSLLHSLWQASALAALAYLAANTLGARSAHARYWIYSAALVAMAACLPATLFVLSEQELTHSSVATGVVQAQTAAAVPVPVPLSAQPQASEPVVEVTIPQPPVTSAVGEASGATAVLERDVWRELAPYAATIYLVGVVAMLLRLLAAVWGGGRLRSESSLAGGEVEAHLRRQARQLGLRWTPVAKYCQRVAAPAVIGIVRPVILLPVALATNLTADEVEALLAHELAHICRHDHWMNLLQRLLEAVLFFHPAAWCVSRKISIEREHCCDDLVLACGTPKLTYAQLLLRVAELCRQPSSSAEAAMLAADGQRPSHLRARIERFLNGEQAPRVRLTRGGTIGLVVMLGGIVATSAAVLHSSEQLAGEQPRAQAEAAPPTVPNDKKSSTADDGLKLTLANGGTVELLAVSHHSTVEQLWWSPSGQVLRNANFSSRSGTITSFNKNEEARQFVFQFKLPAGDVSHVYRPGKSHWTLDAQQAGAEVPGMELLGVIVAKDAKSTNIRIGVAGGEWKAALSTDGKSLTAAGVGSVAVACGKADERNGVTQLSVSHNQTDSECRVVAIDHAKKEHICSHDSASAGARQLAMQVASFPNLPLAEIKFFQVQFRPYQWFEFRNIALRPGTATEAEVRALDGSGVTRTKPEQALWAELDRDVDPGIGTRTPANAQADAPAESVATSTGDTAGRVVDGTGKPVAGATVRISWDKPGRAVGPPSVQTNEQGYFSLPALAADDRIHLNIEAPGCLSREYAEVFRSADGRLYPAERVWEIKRLAKLTGKVIGPDGKPLARAPVSMTTLVDYKHASIKTGNHLRGITDENGILKMDVPAGEHMLVFPWQGPTTGDLDKWRELLGVNYPRGPVTDVFTGALVRFADGEEPSPVTLDLSKSTAQVKGRVVDATGQSIADMGVSVGLKTPNGNYLLGASTATNAQGEFRLQHLPPGDWFVFSGDATRQVEPQAVALRSGEESTVELHAGTIQDQSMPREFQVSRKEESAIWFHTGERVDFVLYHRGFLQSGMSSSKNVDAWRFQGSIHILDGREFPVLFESKDERTLKLDGKSYDLRKGHVFVLNAESDPRQLDIDPLRPTEKNMPELGRKIAATLQAEKPDESRLNKTIPGAAAKTTEIAQAPKDPAEVEQQEIVLTCTLEDDVRKPLQVELQDEYSRPVKTWKNTAPGKLFLEVPKLEVGDYYLLLSAEGFATRRVFVRVSRQGTTLSTDRTELYRKRYIVLRYATNMYEDRSLKGPDVKEGRVAICYGSVPDLAGDWLVEQYAVDGSKLPAFRFHRQGRNGFARAPASASFDEIDQAPPPDRYSSSEAVVPEKGMILLNRIEGNNPRDRRYAKILVEDVTETPPKDIDVIDSHRAPTVFPERTPRKKEPAATDRSSGQVSVTIALADGARAPTRLVLRDTHWNFHDWKLLKEWEVGDSGEIKVTLPGLESDRYYLEASAKGYAPAASMITVSDDGVQPTATRIEIHPLRYVVLRYAINTKGERSLAGPDVIEGRAALLFGQLPDLKYWSVGQSKGHARAVVHAVLEDTGFATAPQGKKFEELVLAPPKDEYSPDEFDFKKGMLLFNRVTGVSPEHERYAKLLVEDVLDTPPKNMEVIDTRKK